MRTGPHGADLLYNRPYIKSVPTTSFMSYGIKYYPYIERTAKACHKTQRVQRRVLNYCFDTKNISEIFTAEWFCFPWDKLLLVYQVHSTQGVLLLDVGRRKFYY